MLEPLGQTQPFTPLPLKPWQCPRGTSPTLLSLALGAGPKHLHKDELSCFYLGEHGTNAPRVCALRILHPHSRLRPHGHPNKPVQTQAVCSPARRDVSPHVPNRFFEEL